MLGLAACLGYWARGGRERGVGRGEARGVTGEAGGGGAEVLIQQNTRDRARRVNRGIAVRLREEGGRRGGMTGEETQFLTICTEKTVEGIAALVGIVPSPNIATVRGVGLARGLTLHTKRT